MEDHFPCAAGTKGNAAAAKGTRKDKNGRPQVCFAWRNTGICKKKDEGTCVDAHPQDQKNVWKLLGCKGKGKGKDGKRSSSTQSRGSRGSKGDSRGKSTESQRSRVVTYQRLLCQSYLKGKCNKGKACAYHSNGPCTFHNKGICNKSDKCVFSHHEQQPAASATTQPTPNNVAEPKPPKGPQSATAKEKAGKAKEKA